MSKWDMVQLGDVCLKTENENPTSYDKEIAYIDISSISSDNKKVTDYNVIFSKDAPSRARQKVQYGDILVSTVRPNLNAVAIVENKSEDIIASTGFCVLRPDNKQVNNKYLFEFVKSPSFVISMTRQATGASYPAVSNKIVMSEQLSLPPLPVQQKIANVLDKASALIEKRKAQIGKLDLLIKSRFIEMFGDPETNIKRWPVVLLKDLFNIRSSKRVYQNEQTSQGVPFLRVADLVQKIDRGGNTCVLFISDEQYEFFLQNGLVPKHQDILVTTRGTLGKCYIIQSNDRFYFQDGMISWLDKADAEVESIYISISFEMGNIKKQITNVSKGATVDFLSLDKMGKLKVMLPDYKIQQQFVTSVQQIEKQKKLLQQSLEKLELNYKSLMQKCFRGEMF